MNLQHFILEHPGILAIAFPIYFVLLWAGIGGLISVVGGWFSLARVYRAQAPFEGVKFKMQSGQMRWRAGYNNVLTLGADQQGLYLATLFLFRFLHPPLLIPWNEIKVSKQKGWIFEQEVFTLGHELRIPLRIRVALAEKLQASAGTSWPVEEN
jgi:hypothetical protein